MSIEAEISSVVSEFVAGLVDLVRQTALEAARAALGGTAYPAIKSSHPSRDVAAVNVGRRAPGPTGNAAFAGAVTSPVSGQRIIPTPSTPILPVVPPKALPPLQLS